MKKYLLLLLIAAIASPSFAQTKKATTTKKKTTTQPQLVKVIPQSGTTIAQAETKGVATTTAATTAAKTTVPTTTQTQSAVNSTAQKSASEASSSSSSISVPSVPNPLDIISGLTIGAGYGLTSGLNFSLGYRPFQSTLGFFSIFGLRLEANYLNALRIPQSNVNDLIQRKTDTELDFSKGKAIFSSESYGILLDVYPLKKILRITGGFYRQNSKLNGAVQLSGNVTIGDTTYPFPDGYTMYGEMNWSKKFTPYLGLGIDIPVLPGLAITTDLGTMFTPSPSMTLSLYGPNSTYVSPDDLRKEEEWIESKIKKAKYIPILRIGVSYKF